jgi:hypothetical protein
MELIMAVAKPVVDKEKVVKNALRIQFAAAALTGLIARGSTLDHEALCKVAMHYADAMLEVIKK